MPTGFDTAFRKVRELVATFRDNEKYFLSPQHQEQEARRDFIDKFWLALGWDVMLAARKQLAAAQSDKDKDFYTNRCDDLDRKIDALVYELYALTPDEIKIVEA